MKSNKSRKLTQIYLMYETLSYGTKLLLFLLLFLNYTT
jgi:hypothetical protein